jgi:hypothetical protein
MRQGWPSRPNDFTVRPIASSLLSLPSQQTLFLKDNNALELGAIEFCQP